MGRSIFVKPCGLINFLLWWNGLWKEYFRHFLVILIVTNGFITFQLYGNNTGQTWPYVSSAIVGLKTDAVLSQHLLVQSQQYKRHLYCSLWTDFTHYSGISIVEFEKVHADWVIAEDSRARTESLSTGNTII